MSKDNAPLRLLGSPVNLSYRSKKKDDRKNIRNRPRSALQNSCFTPESQERHKRPFSADTSERVQTKNFYKSHSTEVLPSFHNNFPITTIRILPPTTELLRDSRSGTAQCVNNKEVCSNASDYGSEDTFISLGTKIKARAQLGPKKIHNKNFQKYKNISKKCRKLTEKDEDKNNYGLEVKITKRSPSPETKEFERCLSPSYKTRNYESFFVPLAPKTMNDDALAGRVSFSSDNLQAEVEEAIDSYSRRLTMTRQQLSLVEEESTQDVDSVPSQQMSSLSPENSLEDAKKDDKFEENMTGRNTYVIAVQEDEYPKKQNFINESRTYSSFYDDFPTNSADPYKSKMSSTVIHTDSSSKDSGYHDSGANDDKGYCRSYSLPSTSSLKNSSALNKTEEPKSLESASSDSKDKDYKSSTYPPAKSQWSEPLNHSRLLYKDFFLKKEGHVALPPQNSPKNEENIIPDTGEDLVKEANDEDINSQDGNDNTSIAYPSYLLNSSTKAYTSKVIEDYKKELQAINNLHELTLKDIKTDAISPTPLNIDKMFEENTPEFKIPSSKFNKQNTNDHAQVPTKIVPLKRKKPIESAQRDISSVSTKELIQNYLKVKEADYTKDYKNIKKCDKMGNNSGPADSISSLHNQDLSNKNYLPVNSSADQSSLKSQPPKNVFTMRTPLSARIEGVNKDKDIDSWMSMTAETPRRLEDDEAEKPGSSKSQPGDVDKEIEIRDARVPNATEVEPPKSSKEPSKDLNQNSTVLDIYSMLKEIESFGDNPVTSVSNINITESTEPKKEEIYNERLSTPKDNFMEILEFLDTVEKSANDALSVVTTAAPFSTPKLEQLLKLSHTELAQRFVTASLQLEERSCCIALLQESLANHKEQMIQKVNNLEKQSLRNISKVKQECEETIKRHQNFIDQLINDKKTLNHRIEQLVDERRSLEDRWKRSAQALEERYKLELRNQHDKMVAAQQVARQRWVRQKAEKIKELTVKGLEGELREMAERQTREVADLKMSHAEVVGKMQARHAAELEELRRTMDDEKEKALVKERQLASSRLEKQILELELSYQEQRTRLVAEMRAENERVANGLCERERAQREQLERWKEEQEKLMLEKRIQLEQEVTEERAKVEESLCQKQHELEMKFEQYRKDFEAEQQIILKKKIADVTAQHKQERDREIEKAIESMDAEAQAGRKELQEALRRNKEQYEAELKELAETEQATLRRYQDAQARVRQTEDKCGELEVMISQLETRNKVLTEKNTQLEAQCEDVRVRCEEAWRSKVDDLKKEMEDLKRVHEEQMHQLYAKVKVAVARKDTAIQALTRESGKQLEKITMLEQKLQQQRKDYLRHK